MLFRLLEVLDRVVPEVVELVLDVRVVLEHGQESLGADLVDVSSEVRPSVLKVKATKFTNWSSTICLAIVLLSFG